MNETEVIMLWRKLFRGQPVTRLTLGAAETLVSELKLESPLRHRLQTELEELRTIHPQ